MDPATGRAPDPAHWDQLAINPIRFLSVDAVQKANSGHPGLPMGAATMAFVLWTRLLRHNPANPHWFNRDRFVLSAGHGSMLLYSLLHLMGYDLPLEQIKQFRKWGSLTPGHPERGITPGVEVTTGGHPGRPPYDGASRRQRFVTRQRSPPPGQPRGPAGWRNRRLARQLRKPLQTLMRSERKVAMEHANTMVLTGAPIWLVGYAPTKVAVLEPIGPGPTRLGEPGRWLSPSLGLGAR